MRYNPKAKLDSSQLFDKGQKRPGGHTYASRFDRMEEGVESETAEQKRRRLALLRRYRRTGGLTSR
jgi:hypothetical protein